MAELTAQNLYDQLTPMSKMYYDQQFRKQYVPGKENILLSSQPEYNKMQAIYEAEQQVPEKSFLDSINIFGSASAAEPDKISSVSTTPGFQTILKPNGTIEIVPVDTSSSLPFNVGNRLFDEFNTATAVPNQTPFDPRSLQSIFPTNVKTGIMTQAPTSLGFDTSLGVANEEDVEQVDYLGSKPNKVQTGIAKLFEFLQRFSPIGNIARGIESIRNRFDTRKAIRDDIIRDRQGTINNIVSPRIMNMQPTAQDIARGGGNIPTRTTSRRTSPQGGMRAERTRSRDLGRMRGGVGR